MIFLMMSIRDSSNSITFGAEVLRCHDATLKEVDIANDIKMVLEKSVKDYGMPNNKKTKEPTKPEVKP